MIPAPISNFQNFNQYRLAASIDDGDEYNGLYYDGTYIYIARSVTGLSVYSFNGTGLTLLDTDDDSAGVDFNGVTGYGSYIFVTSSNFPNAAKYNGLYAYSFNGTTLTKITEITQSQGGDDTYGDVNTDGTYIYVSRLYKGFDAYSFNGSTFTYKDNNQTYLSLNGDVLCSGGYIYVTGTNGISAFSFNGTTISGITTIENADIPLVPET